MGVSYIYPGLSSVSGCVYSGITWTIWCKTSMQDWYSQWMLFQGKCKAIKVVHDWLWEDVVMLVFFAICTGALQRGLWCFYNSFLRFGSCGSWRHWNGKTPAVILGSFSWATHQNLRRSLNMSICLTCAVGRRMAHSRLFTGFGGCYSSWLWWVNHQAVQSFFYECNDRWRYHISSIKRLRAQWGQTCWNGQEDAFHSPMDKVVFYKIMIFSSRTFRIGSQIVRMCSWASSGTFT